MNKMPSREEIEGAETIRAQVRAYDLIDVRGAEFRRLLRLALSEGLLGELIRDAVFQGPLEGRQQVPSLLTEHEIQTILSPSKDRDRQRTASGQRHPKWWLKLMPWRFS
jgi:hypothetical protein